MNGNNENILTWDYETTGDLAPWDYDQGILGGMGIDDARAFVRTFDWTTPVADDPKGFETAFAVWQKISIEEVTDGTVAVCRGEITVRRDGKWESVTSMEVAAGPMSFDDAKANLPEFSVAEWFDAPWMHVGIDGAWYILRHVTPVAE